MSIFEFFFKYKPIVYQKGRLAFQLLGSKWWFLPAAALAIVAAYLFYRAVTGEKRSPWLIALRALTLAVLLFMFLRPVLNISTVLPQDSYLAVVIDNSESMTIKDDGKTARSELLNKQLAETSLIKRLSEKFKVRLYRFDKEAERTDKLENLTFNGKSTRIESVTELLHEELGTVPLSGVVLITDGADNASQQFSESLARLESRKIPFYTVGVGTDQISKDAEILKISAPRDMLKESTAVVTVSFRSHGFKGQKGILKVRENDGKLVKSDDVTFAADGEIAEKSVDLPVKNEGFRVFTFSIEAKDDRIAENNSLDALITVRNDHPKILYIEGEPRWEYKYLRRAIEDDKNLVLVSMLRESQNKWIVQGGVDDNDKKLSLDPKDGGGFPKKKEDLYQYKGLIFGSIEAPYFTQDQQDMVVDFVNNRGGGFLMLGGKNSFSGGHYQTSSIADILPVELPSDKLNVFQIVKMMLTDAGKSNTLTKLSPEAEANAKTWADLPALGDFNKTLDAKAGAVVLAKGQAEGGVSPTLMAYQRYGRGRSMAFMSGTSWHWQMELDHKDQTHEMFWKQVLRWMVNSTPDPVMITSDKDTYLPGETVNLSADVADKSFNRMNNARAVVKVTDPMGVVQTLPMDWGGSEDGTYRAQVRTGPEGVYQVNIEAAAGEMPLGTNKSAFQVKNRPVEFYNASLDANSLKAIAGQTGGRYYPLSKMGDIPDDAIYVEGESSFVEQKELWDVPALFMLLCASLGGEWLLRKIKGLA
jgi:hypothetical protein